MPVGTSWQPGRQLFPISALSGKYDTRVNTAQAAKPCRLPWLGALTLVRGCAGAAPEPQQAVFWHGAAPEAAAEEPSCLKHSPESFHPGCSHSFAGDTRLCCTDEQSPDAQTRQAHHAEPQHSVGTPALVFGKYLYPPA